MSYADARAADLAFAALPADYLSRFRTLPRPEPRRRLRARMAASISSLVAANGCITREELAACGFSEPEILDHFRGALRVSKAAEMVA